jgi:hypothetical protein
MRIGPDESRELLERHRPLLRFDPQYDYRVLAARSAVGNAGNLLRRPDGEVLARSGGAPPLTLDTLSGYPAGLEQRFDDCLSMAPDYPGDARRMEWEEEHRGHIYGRVVEDGGRTWLQYWFWLYYNPKNLFGLGKHEGDWEMVQVGLGADGSPEVATYAQHDSGEARGWDRVERLPDDPRRPVVYVAPLSHASYFEAGTHPYFVGIDHPYADGPASDLPVMPFGRWVRWKGRWGNSERTIARRIGNGPRSPRWQGPKWDRPAAWHRSMSGRRPRVLLGRAAHALGNLTYPAPPRVTGVRLEPGRALIEHELGGDGRRAGRHLYLTVHEQHYVIASRVLRRAERAGITTVLLPEGRHPTAVMASAYNRLRQRSDVAAQPLPEAASSRLASRSMPSSRAAAAALE